MVSFNKISKVLLIICIIFPSLGAAERFSKEKKDNLPIEITAEKMISYQKSNKIIFIGNVVAKQGKLTISSDTMTVYNDKKGGKLK